MKLNSKFTRLILVLVLLLLPTGLVHAQSSGGDVVLFGQSYTLKAGDTLNGNIAVFGGNITIEEEAEVNGSVVIFGGNVSIEETADLNGDIAVFGGNLQIDGTISGDVVIFGGQANLAETAFVDGGIATFGGQVNQDPGAEVSGEITNNEPVTPETPEIPSPDIKVDYNPIAELTWAIFRAFVVAGISMVAALFLQPQLERVGDVMTRQTFTAGSFGLLAAVVIPIAIVVMTLTFILIPVAAITFLIAGLAWLFGVIALGHEVGTRFTRSINQTWAPALTDGFGTFFLVLILNLMNFVPCVGWLPGFLVSLIASGAVFMTWFGTRNPPGYMPAVVSTETE